MEVSQHALAWMLLSSFLCGLALGICYDMLRLTRMWVGVELPPPAKRLRERMALPQRLRWATEKAKVPKSQKLSETAKYIFLLAEDILFCLLIAITLVLLLYRANDGQFRLSAVVLLFGGLAAYLMTLGRLVKQCSGIIVVTVRAVFVWSGAILTYPFAWLIRLLVKWTAPVRTKIRKFYLGLKQKAQSRKQARLAHKIYKKQNEATDPRPINGKHYFSMGGQTVGKT